jgi:CRISPR-associated protein Csb1
MTITFDDLKAAVASKAAAFRCITEYQPAGGPGDKVFPPTYEGGKYATETRIIDGAPVDCVILDSVQSQANRNEQALLEACRAGRLLLPLLVARFDNEKLLKRFTVTSLDAPHRAADAIFRDCTLGDVIFRKSEKGRALDTVDIRNATALFGLNPTALVFGLWDSTGPRGGLGAKFQRALVSELVGYGAVPGVKTGSRIDPAQIMKGAGPLYARKNESNDAPAWTLDKDQGGKKIGGKKGKEGEGNPSDANHGNIPPQIDRQSGGFTIAKAIQTTVLSLATLRRLRFPLEGSAESDPSVDAIARTALATIGLAAATLTREEGADLRSRCQLVPNQVFVWELLDQPGQEPKRFELTGNEAIALCNEAIEAAKAAHLPWEGEIQLQPSSELIELVSRSQTLAAAEGGEID